MPPTTDPPRSGPPTRVDELVQILNHLEAVACDSVVGEKTNTACTALETGADPEDITELLLDATAVAVEGTYRQRVVDLLMLATEHIDGRYTVPPENIPDDVLPDEYPAEKLSTES
jgi:hypothetical protein